MNQENNKRIQTISEIQNRISDLRTTFDTFSSSSTHPYRRETRGDEIVTGDFGLKSTE